MIQFVHILDRHNFGDAVCSPRNYFPEWAGFSEVDFRDLKPGTDPVILGGGGLLHPGVDKWIQDTAKTRPMIVWGIGLNYHASAPPSGWETFLSHCKLVGLRDRGTRFTNVPDATCMHSFLDWPVQRCSERAVAYSHFERPISLGIPEINNHTAPGKTLESVLKFLMTGETVVTNSYHGAYWSLLLGRRTILWKPFSTRFFSGLPIALPVATTERDFRELTADSPTREPVPHFLHHARSVTRDFREKVRGLLNI